MKERDNGEHVTTPFKIFALQSSVWKKFYLVQSWCFFPLASSTMSLLFHFTHFTLVCTHSTSLLMINSFFFPSSFFLRKKDKKSSFPDLLTCPHTCTLNLRRVSYYLFIYFFIFLLLQSQLQRFTYVDMNWQTLNWLW